MKKAGDYITGKEVVNLINKLQHEGMTDSRIIEIIKYVELTPSMNYSEKKRSIKLKHKN